MPRSHSCERRGEERRLGHEKKTQSAVRTGDITVQTDAESKHDFAHGAIPLDHRVWGRLASVGNLRAVVKRAILRRLPIGAQDSILLHKLVPDLPRQSDLADQIRETRVGAQ